MEDQTDRILSLIGWLLGIGLSLVAFIAVCQLFSIARKLAEIADHLSAIRSLTPGSKHVYGSK